MKPFSSDAAFCSKWVPLPSSLREDVLVLAGALSGLNFDHGIRNWDVAFVVDPAVQRKTLPHANLSGDDIVAVFGVDPEAWNTPHPDVWDHAGFAARSRYLDDQMNVLSGNKNLQRDRAMRSVGVASGILAAKAREMKYRACFFFDFDVEDVVRGANLPPSYEVASVVILKRAMQSLGGERENFVPVFSDGERMLELG